MRGIDINDFSTWVIWPDWHCLSDLEAPFFAPSLECPFFSFKSQAFFFLLVPSNAQICTLFFLSLLFGWINLFHLWFVAPFVVRLVDWVLHCDFLHLLLCVKEKLILKYLKLGLCTFELFVVVRGSEKHLELKLKWMCWFLSSSFCFHFWFL